mmetsp:Transcript_22083/g.38151  ORF Transcript_22083/g.38151 Transcript_22083/m.38151 type:complete len:98 (+) Transcript_22083:23-316(+)
MAPPPLASFINKRVICLQQDGRTVIGMLRGCDQTHNIILEEAFERIFDAKAKMTSLELGVVVIRGDNVAIVGEINEGLDGKIRWEEIHGQQLKPIVH